MATHKISSSFILNSPNTAAKNAGIFSGYTTFVDSQKPNEIAWWLGSLMLHGCILVPLTFLLVYSLGGPSLPFLFISMISFFINVIANMGGAPFRFTFNSFMFSIAIHIAMVVTTLMIAL